MSESGSETVTIGGGDHKVVVYGNGTVYAGDGNDSITIHGKGKVIAGNGNDTITVFGSQGRGEGDGEEGRSHGNSTISVGSGNDSITLYGNGKITETGLSGHDTINLGSGNDTIYEQGHATVYGSFGSTTISGGELVVSHKHGVTEEIAVSGKMTLLGSGSPTEFVGGTGSSVFHGGKGSDTFIGGSGHDTMIGGSGKNVFEFLSSEKGGQHVITNFVSGDKLYIEGHSLSYLTSHHDITTSGGNTYISIDGGKTMIELKGFTSLDSSDITTHKPGHHD
jgi:Ca2+-binding RTX toxin-like protein